MGEKFAANPVTGTGTMSVPIPTSPSRAGVAPQLVLSYDSAGGNGPFGLGWALSLPVISRKTDKGLPRYEDSHESDEFVLTGATELVPALAFDGAEWTRQAPAIRSVDGRRYTIQRYRPRVEGSFSRIERWINEADASDCFWRSISRDNLTTIYGKTAESRIADPHDATRIFSWSICQSYDDKGNAIVFDYRAENDDGVDLSRVHERNRTTRGRTANRYPTRIRYGNRQPNRDANWNATDPALLSDSTWMFEAVFDYGDHDGDNPLPEEPGTTWPVRNDPFSSYRAGFEVRTYRLCQRVLMFHHFPDEPGVGAACLVRSTDFGYSQEQDPANARNPIFSVLRTVTQQGYRRRPEGGYLAKALPPVELTYTEPVVDDTVRDIDPKSLENLPYGLDGAQYQWLDLDGEGLSGILTEQGDGWFYKRNLSAANQAAGGGGRTEPRFGAVELVAARPRVDLAGGQAQLVDLAADGALDLVDFRSAVPGFFERVADEGWGAFTPFASVPNVRWDDPQLRFIDLTGDGHADLLVTEQDALTWHRSLGEAGFDRAEQVAKVLDEEHGPALVFADATQSIFLADLSGDGLTDLVRIRNGEVCYWPNLGYGRFGAKVTMDDAPWFDAPERFDHRNIRLADIDGSGLTDIIYLHGSGVRLYFNQSGNSWSQATVLAVFPRIDDLAGITVVDLLGTGTACLVWSSALPGDAGRPMRYVDLMGNQKPHLLVGSVNNLGSETRVHYAPSTRFYIEDKLAGRPWISRLPFPVQVIERVETYDHISRNRFVTRHAYHHGHFDGVEREFCGFGLVEQFDTEEFGALSQGGALPAGDNVDAASHVPPVYTKTWFHTGVCFDGTRVSNYFAGLEDEHDTGEYYREPGLTDLDAAALLLPDTVLPDGLTADEQREACRAFKGFMLRKEVYALDGSDKQPHPYSVSEQNFTARLVQPFGPNRHAVVVAHPRESIAYHYERNPADPRIAHNLVLEVDDFGNTVTSAAVVYGRRQPDPALAPRDQATQSAIQITYEENSLTNAVDADDDYRIPIRWDARTFDLTGLGVPPGHGRYGFQEIASAAAGAASIAYEQTPTPGVLQKRIIEHARSRLRRNDLAGALPFGALESLGIPFEHYKLAFTPGLVAQVFGDRVTDGMLEEEGRYVHLDGDDQWWARSGLVFLSPGPADLPAQELAHARQHFFLAHRFRDPFHTAGVSTETVVTYDADRVAIAEIRDALGNTTRTRHDYRVLAPRVMTDANGNRSAVSFDILGMVDRLAIMGKEVEPDGRPKGDRLDGVVQEPSQAQVDAFLAAPREPGPTPDESVAAAIAHELLGDATARFVYDRDRFRRFGEPPVAATILRETHVSDLAPGGRSKLQVSFSYSDGFGREIQQKIQAEPGPVPQRGADGAIVVDADGAPVTSTQPASPRWVGTGWTIFNNKGQVVRQHEPFFTDRPQFEFDVRIGVSPVLLYDPLGRTVATLHPNHTWQKVIVDPWRQETWDVNDTVLIDDPAADPDVGAHFLRLPDAAYLPTWHAARRSGGLGAHEQAAAAKTGIHAGTPSVAHADAMGRPFLAIAHNRFERGGTVVDERYQTRVVFDAEGNERAVFDESDRLVMRYDFDMLGSRIHQASMEAGERWTLSDVASRPIRTWDSRNRRVQLTYDPLQRPLDTFLEEGNEPRRLVGRAVYGESRADPETRNVRGQLVERLDQAGAFVGDEFDFKGNLLASRRQFARDYKATLDWSAGPELEPPVFTGRTTFDALDRPTSMTLPDGSIHRATFSEANLLETIDVHLRGAAAATSFVSDIDYNEKGQRTFIAYGNGTRTDYQYDRFTFGLTRLRTVREADQALLQDLTFTFDPAGNITRIGDTAQQSVYFDNQVVEPTAAYTYDATYRLVSAEGREHIGQAARPEIIWDDRFRTHQPHRTDGQAMRRYAQHYEYDTAGNFVRMVHEATGGSWTRSFTYDEPSLLEPARTSNRLTRTAVGSVNPLVESYTHDEHGNMTAMSHLPSMTWDFGETLREVDLGGGGVAYYVYDAGGRRVRKIIERNGGALIDDRMYLDAFEVFRRTTGSGTVVVERETLHVMDDARRIAIVETRTQGDDGSPEQVIGFQLAGHNASALLEIDDAGQIISYEEYYPFGSTSYQAVRGASEVSLKRYRYTGMERDDESGLSYHGARYCAPWLGRWTSCEPTGVAAGTNLFTYAFNNPLRYIDADGLKPSETDMILNELWQWGVKLGARYEGTSPSGTRLHKVLQEELPKAVGNNSRLITEAIIDKDGFVRRYDVAPGATSGLPGGRIKGTYQTIDVLVVDDSVSLKDVARIRSGQLSAKGKVVPVDLKFGKAALSSDAIDGLTERLGHAPLNIGQLGRFFANRRGLRRIVKKMDELGVLDAAAKVARSAKSGLRFASKAAGPVGWAVEGALLAADVYETIDRFVGNIDRMREAREKEFDEIEKLLASTRTKASDEAPVTVVAPVESPPPPPPEPPPPPPPVITRPVQTQRTGPEYQGGFWLLAGAIILAAGVPGGPICAPPMPVQILPQAAWCGPPGR